MLTTFRLKQQYFVSDILIIICEEFFTQSFFLNLDVEMKDMKC